MHLHNSCACAHKTVLTHANGILTHKAPNQACCRVYPSSTTRVQSSIDSRNSAIHKGYHTSLRPSSLSKPRHPSLKVVISQRKVEGQLHTHTHTSLHTHGSRLKATGLRYSNLLPLKFHTRDSVTHHPPRISCSYFKLKHVDACE